MKEYVRPLPRPTTILIKDAKYLLTSEGTLRNKSLFVNDRRIVAIDDAHSI